MSILAFIFMISKYNFPMDYRNKLILFLCIIGTVFLSSEIKAQNNELIFIGNEIGAAEMSFSKMVEYYKAKTAYWDNNKAVTICLPGTKSPDAERICSIIYKKSVRDVQKFWLSIVFQGRAKSPMFFEREEEMIEYIKKTPGAIGVLLNKPRPELPSQLIIKVRN